jgi:hypothetical protein
MFTKGYTVERVYTLFISYSQDASLFKQIIEKQLKKISDLTIIDRTMGTMKDTIALADFFLVLLTKKDFKSKNIRNEIKVAKSMKKRIIAVVEVSDHITQIQEMVPEAEFLEYEHNEPTSVLDKLYATVNRLMQREPARARIKRANEDRINLETLILGKMSESRLKTFAPIDLAIDIGAPLTDIRNTIKNLEGNELVSKLEGGYYSITYKGLDRVRGRSRMYQQR